MRILVTISGARIEAILGQVAARVGLDGENEWLALHVTDTRPLDEVEGLGRGLLGRGRRAGEMLARIDQEATKQGMDDIRQKTIERQIAINKDPVEDMRLRLALAGLHEGLSHDPAARSTICRFISAVTARLMVDLWVRVHWAMYCALQASWRKPSVASTRHSGISSP